ncbi:MAG: AraC family transcriptional regulator [Methylobacteriaceae bacterium]|nr:AraC family transcriptional regulator [Methylobacteriaceae bacterium]
MPLAPPRVLLDPAHRAAGDVAHFWHAPLGHGLGCLRATFRRHAYARHSHDTYAVAAIVAGCETFFHRGTQHYAQPGEVAVVCPDEIHDGAPHDGGFVYRTIYPSVALMTEIAEEATGRRLARPPHFRVSVVPDPELAGDLARLHGTLQAADRSAWLLAADTELVSLLTRLILRWADLDAAPRSPVLARPVARARDYLDAHFAEEVELAALAQVAGVSRPHLIRAFRREVGLTPHAYLVDRRFREAARLLGRGEAPGEVAAACGFCDQSHLNRVFKARMAVTPGAYRGPPSGGFRKAALGAG